MHWISVVQDGDKRRAFVKKAMNRWIPLNAGSSSTSSGTSAIQEELVLSKRNSPAWCC